MNENKMAGVRKSTKMFVSGVAVLTVSNILVKIIGLVFKIPLHNYLGDEGMGYFNAAYTIYTWFFMISTAGIPVAISILISESRAAGNFRQVKKIFRISLWLFFLIGLGGALLLGFGSSFFANNLIKLPPSNLCMIAIAPTLFFVCITSAFRGYFQGHQVMMPTGISQLIESLGKLVFGIILANFALNTMGYELPLAAAYTISGLTIGVAVGMLFLIVVKIFFNDKKCNQEYLLPDSYTMQTSPTKSILSRLVKIAVPVTISSSVMSLANLIDLTVVSRRLQDAAGFSENVAAEMYGNYTTLAVPMFNLPPVLIYPIAYSLVPMLSAILKQNDELRAKRLMNSSLKVASIISIPCAVGMGVLAYPILALLFGADGSAVMAAPLLSILASSSFFVSMLSITNAILQATGHATRPLISMLVGAAVKIIVSYILIGIPAVNIYGAPISTGICYLIVISMNFYFAVKYSSLKFSVADTFVRPAAAAVLCGAAAALSYRAAEILISSQKLCTLIAIAVAVIVYALAIFVTKSITKDDVMLLPKGEKIYALLHKIKLMK